MRTKLLPMILGAALTLVLAAATACGDDETKAAPTPDTAAIQAAVKAALPAPAPAPVSAAEIQQMVKGAISEIPAPDVPEQLSSAEFQRLVEAAVTASAAKATKPLSASEIKALVSSAVEAATSEAASKGELEALIVKATDEAAAAAAAAALAAVPTAVMAPAAMTSDIKRGGTFILGTPQQITTLDGTAAGPANNQTAKEGLLGTHTRYTLGGVVGPHLFASWDISPDLTVFTFTIQDGVKWHNGRDMDAEDHRFSLQRGIETESPYAGLFKDVTNIETLDASTVRLTSPVPNAVMPNSFYRTYLVAKENVSNAQGGTAGSEDDFSVPVGTGPFKFMEWVTGEKVVMDRFQDYWQMGEDGKSLPYLDRVEVRTVPDSTSLLAALKAGEVHFYWQLPPRLFPALQFDKNADAVLSEFSTAHWYFSLEQDRTTGDNVFADIRARRAVLLALDKQQIVEVGWGVTAAPILTNQFLPSNFPLAGKGFPDIERDVEEAKRLFAEVGITELHFNSWDAPAWTPVSEVIQQNLAEAGVKTILHVSRVADWSCAMGRGDCGPDWKWPNMISVDGVSNPPDPSFHIAPWWTCPGHDTSGKFCNEEMDKIAKAATQTTDFDERARLYQEWSQMWIDVIPAISFIQLPFYHGNYKSLKGVVNLFGMPFYEAAWLDE